MTTNTQNSDNSQYAGPHSKVTRYTLTSLLIGVIYLLIAWILHISLTEIPLTFSGILQIHVTSPSIILIDLLPVIITITTFIAAKQHERTQLIYEEEIQNKNDIIERNARIARMIGQKNFSFSEEDIPANDSLGEALLITSKNLEETDRKEQEQNWLSTGKDKISNVLRQYNTLNELAYNTLESFIDYIEAIQGAFYVFDDEKNILYNAATYAYNRRKYIKQEFRIGEGLIGEAAYEMDIIYRKEIPDNYMTITSGILGDKKPKTLLIIPLISDEKLQGIIEVASLKEDMPEITIRFARELGEIIGQTVFNLKVNKRTEKLLHDSQVMTKELKANEEELRKNAIEMQKTQEELEKANKDLEKQIEEVENAQKRLHALLENASEVITIYDNNGTITYVSPSVKRILGYDPEAIQNTNIYNTTESQGYKKIKEAYEFLLENPSETKVFEYTFNKNEEETLHLEATGRNLLNNPAINGIIFNTRDITVRKIAEQAEKRSGQMQALSENSPDMIMRVNEKGEFFYVNPVVEKYTGLLENNILNKHLSEVNMHEGMITVFQNIMETVKQQKQKYEIEQNLPTMEGEKTMVVNGIPEFNEEAEIESILFTAHDITVQKEIEEEIRAKNKAINDSINYAQRIQTAILPNNERIKDFIPNSFIYYKPRDVVSGDFPWFFDGGDVMYIAAIDCTGHGVPGAMLSFIGYFLLNNIVTQNPHNKASEILDKFHLRVRKTLRQESPDASARDGMDIAFCKIDKNNETLEYAGAHRPLYLLRDNELYSYRGDAKAIGGIPFRKKKEEPFTNYEIKYQAEDKFFFFSDGLPDQIGGPKRRKYKSIRVRQQIKDHNSYTMEQFHQLFKNDFEEWQGNNKQIDDMLLIGLQLK